MSNNAFNLDNLFFDNIHLLFGKEFKIKLIHDTFDKEGYTLEDSISFKFMDKTKTEEDILLRIADIILKDVFDGFKNKIKDDKTNNIIEYIKKIFYDYDDIIKTINKTSDINNLEFKKYILKEILIKKMNMSDKEINDDILNIYFENYITNDIINILKNLTTEIEINESDNLLKINESELNNEFIDSLKKISQPSQHGQSNQSNQSNQPSQPNNLLDVLIENNVLFNLYTDFLKNLFSNYEYHINELNKLHDFDTKLSHNSNKFKYMYKLFFYVNWYLYALLMNITMQLHIIYETNITNTTNDKYVKLKDFKEDYKRRLDSINHIFYELSYDSFLNNPQSKFKKITNIYYSLFKEINETSYKKIENFILDVYKLMGLQINNGIISYTELNIENETELKDIFKNFIVKTSSFFEINSENSQGSPSSRSTSKNRTTLNTDERGSSSRYFYNAESDGDDSDPRSFSRSSSGSFYNAEFYGGGIYSLESLKRDIREKISMIKPKLIEA
jgi:hypothetical protein